mgnify:CR=1 FL=1
MSKKIIHVSSLLIPAKNLFIYFGDRLVELETVPGQFTSFGMSINHRDHLQDLGIPPDRRCPTTFSLNQEPLSIRVDFFTPDTTLSIYRNGAITPYLRGSLEDRKGNIGLSLGYRSVENSRILHEGRSPQQQYIFRVAGKNLEHLITREQVLV